MEKAKNRASKTERTKAGEKGRKQREEYFKIKAFALEREKENFSKLFVIHEKKNWWKMIGNSALIFHYDIAKRIKYASKLMEDSDFECRSEEGVVNIKSIYDLEAKLEANKIYYLDTQEEYKIFNIGKRYTKDDIERLKKARELEWEKINSIVLPKQIHPLLFKSERELLETLYTYTKRIEPYIREVVANPMLERASWMVREYSMMANGVGMEEKEYLEKILVNTKWMTSQTIIISELRLAEPERIFRLLKSIENLRKDAERCLSRIK
ncbi:hypothetical protein IJF91_00450 [Candidatus Saccharibacteria bacterium]|nr:hypothetical protein [Candidatus Saccharibacteria bacterium]